MEKVCIDDILEAEKQRAKSGKSLGLSLLKTGLITKQDVVEALSLRIQEEIFDLFLWTAGNFEFEMNRCPEHLFDDLQKSAPVSVNANSVIMEGLRRVDEWGLIHAHIRTFNEIFVRVTEPPEDLKALDAHFLSRIDGARPVLGLLS